VQEFKRLHARTFDDCLCALDKEESADRDFRLRQRCPEISVRCGGPTEQRG
jgi:hypothetical protein